jgi:uncharacterized protein YwqG
MAADRRGFFKDLLKEVAGVAQELQAFRLGEALAPEEEPGPMFETAPPLPAAPAKPIPESTLADLGEELGLAQRAEDLRRLVRASVRLTPAPGTESATRLGGSPDVPPGFEWPTFRERELDFLAQVRLEDLPPVADSPLPPRGLLLFFYDIRDKTSGSSPSHRGSCRVVHVADAADARPDDSRTPALAATPLTASTELTLPGAWTMRSQALDLTTDEADAWDDLRGRLADAHGVELEERTSDWYSLHRLIGYHEEIGREIELECALAAAGIDAEDTEAYFEAQEKYDERSLEWSLLLQVSSDDAAGAKWDLHGAFGRLYICIRQDDLRAGDFGGAWAILR